MINIDKNLADNVANKILNIIKKTTAKTINSSNVEMFYNGIITVAPTDDDNKATVLLSFGVTVTAPNLSGSPLSVGDKVKVYSDKQNLANAYIGLKY